MSRTPVSAPQRQRGFTLIEILITMVVFTIIIGAAFSFLTSQGKSFRGISERSGLVQNMRFGRDLLRQEIRTAGTNVVDGQPMIVYASDSVFAFNADLTTNVEDSVRLTGAVYVDPNAPNASVSAMQVADAEQVPGSLPSFSYPLASYSQNAAVFVNSDAETITFWFMPDTTTSVTGDYVLYRRTNRLPAEVILRGVRRNGSTPFLRYWYDPARYGAVSAPLDTVPRGWLPLQKDVAQRGFMPDTGTNATTRIDQLRAVEVNYSVAARRDASASVKLVNYMVPMPNTAHPRMRRICGRVPIFGRAVTATWRNAPAPAGIELTWAAAVDQLAGESDAVRYVIWRRVVGSPDWGDPHVTVGVSGAAYTWKDASASSGVRYEYNVAVQDCTPNVSTPSTSNQVLVP